MSSQEVLAVAISAQVSPLTAWKCSRPWSLFMIVFRHEAEPNVGSFVVSQSCFRDHHFNYYHFFLLILISSQIFEHTT